MLGSASGGGGGGGAMQCRTVLLQGAACLLIASLLLLVQPATAAANSARSGSTLDSHIPAWDATRLGDTGQSILNLVEENVTLPCPSNCSSSGVCTAGVCHCDGFRSTAVCATASVKCCPHLRPMFQQMVCGSSLQHTL